MTRRWYFRCRSCKKSWCVDCPVDEKGRSRSFAESLTIRPCPLCGFCCVDPVTRRIDRTREIRIMGRVEGNTLWAERFGSPCDGRCTGATGPHCDCSCRGDNHGTNRLIKYETIVGSVPKDVFVEVLGAAVEAQADYAKTMTELDT